MNSPEEMTDEPTASQTNPETVIDSQEEKIVEPSENDFDLEPAEPPQTETIDSFEATVSHAEN